MIVLTRYATSMNHISQTWLSGREIHGKRQGRIRWQNHLWEPMLQDIRPKRQPTNQPTIQPASQPTNQPASQPTNQPLAYERAKTSDLPR